VQNGGLVQARQLGHVLDFVELWRIHLLYVVAQDHHPLAGLGQLHFDLVAMLPLNTGGHEALKRDRMGYSRLQSLFPSVFFALCKIQLVCVYFVLQLSG